MVDREPEIIRIKSADGKLSRQVMIADIFTGQQIADALAIWRRNRMPADEIAEKVVRPNIAQINAKLGQENDPKYLAYALEFVFDQTMERGA